MDIFEPSPMEKVFALEEIVAEILKHAKSNNISSVTKLRSVCKLWRKLCFPLLNQSARKFDLHEEWTQLDYFLKTFSSDCSLPLRLDVTSSTWKLRELLFLSTYAANITSVVFKNVPKFAFGFLEVPQSTVILPRLKSLTVIVPRGHFYFPEESDEYQMLETIIGNAKNLNRFRVSLNLDSYHGNEVIPGETLSSKVTSLQITVETNLTILKNWMPHAYLPKLQNLEVYSREIENTAECNEVLSNLYNTFRTSLEEIVCKHSDKNHVMQLRLQKMDKLKCLQVCNSDFVPEKLGCQIPDILPNLVYISISHYGHQLAYYLGKVMEDNCSLGNIQSLKLHTSQSPRNLTDFTDTMVKVIKVTPTLRSLTLIKRDYEPNGQLGRIDLNYLLTGIPQEYMPLNENEWGIVLESRSHGIQNLTHLTNFRLNSTVMTGVIGKFICKALLMLPKLKRLSFEGTITVGASAKLLLKAASREIQVLP